LSMRLPPALFIVIIGTVVAGNPSPQQATPREYPVPGRLIDIGGRKLHMNCSGKGSPTVILLAGGGAYSIDWALVEAKVAESTRVCSYDQAGLGWSDSGPADETVEQTVDDLHTLLRAAGEKGPYLLVGASISGIYIQAYQRAYPDEIAGMVFSNSSNRIGLWVKGKVGLIWEMSEDEIRSAFPRSSDSRDPAPSHEGDPFDKLPPDLQAVRLWLDVRLWEKSDPAKATPDSLLSWRKEFLREFADTDAAQKPPLGNLPIVVVSSDPVAPEAERRSHDGAAARLDFLSSNTVHITASGSGHEIHLYQPDAVVQAISRALSASRGGALLQH